VIRDARAADAAAIAAIWNPIIRDTDITFTSVEKNEAGIAALIADRLTAGHAFLVTESESGLAGFASYAQFRAGPGYARTMEHTIILAPAARGRGIGHALMTALVEHAQGRGVRSLIGGLSGTNRSAIGFHARAGFVEVARIPEAGWKFGRFHDLVLMQKMLDAPHGQGAWPALD
jgi:L-amino acid N-acyltransferase